MEQTFLTIIEFAEKLKVHPNTIRRAIKSGRLSAVRIGSGKRATYRIPLSEINRIAIMDLEFYIEQIVQIRIDKVMNERTSSPETT